MEFIEQIKEVMKESRKEMHVDQIAEAIVAKYPHTQQHLDVLSKKISSILSKDIDKYKTKSEFTKPKNSKGAPRRGIYRLKIKKLYLILFHRHLQLMHCIRARLASLQ